MYNYNFIDLLALVLKSFEYIKIHLVLCSVMYIFTKRKSFHLKLPLSLHIKNNLFAPATIS